jgi:Ca2+-binding EF-hand superfamily protein
MKTTPVSLLLFSIISSTHTLAETTPRKGRPDGDDGKRHFMEAWKQADQNGDNSLSFTEFSSLPRLQAIPEDKRSQLFQRLDKDENDGITREEMQRMGPPNADGENHRKRLWELDTDKNGSITKEELSAGEMFRKLPPEKQQKLFARLDTNQDGVISPEDRPAHPGPGARPGDGSPRNQENDDKEPHRHMFPRLDINSDGSLSFEEFVKSPGISRLGEDEQESAFEKIDSNQDLKLTPEEMTNFRPFESKNDKPHSTDKPHKNQTKPAE